MGVATLVGQMISNMPLNEIQGQVRSSHSLKDLVPEASAIEPPDLETLIVERQLAALARYPADKPRDTALVCLDMARTHPQEVSVLLWKPEVAREAMALLRHAQDTSTPEDTMVALAHALLQAGHSLTGRAWPASVLELLQNRKKANADYWASKVQKFRGQPPKDGLPCFMERGLPFLSLSKQKSAVNLNTRLGAVGKRLVCKHLAMAIQDNPKAFLTRISQRDVSFLDRAALGLRHQESRSRVGLSSVLFTPENFGGLLVRVACGVPWGAVHSFGVSYCQPDVNTFWPFDERSRASKRFATGHAMRVFLEKSSKGPLGDADPMGLKVSFYEPNVTGDMTHLRVLPEHLAKLSLRPFDRRDLCALVDVLSLDVGDPFLAQALAGQFVSRGVEAQVSSFLEALGKGNLHEMRSAASVLQTMGETAHGRLNRHSRELAFAVTMALRNNSADVLVELARSPLLQALVTSTLTDVVLAQRWGLGCAAQRRAVAAITGFGELLAQIEDRVDPQLVREVISLKAVMTCLNRELREDTRGLLEAYGGVLDQVKSKPDAAEFEEVFALKEVRNTPDKALVAWDRVLQAFKSVLNARTILQLFATLSPGPYHWADLLRVFCRHFPALHLPSASFALLLDPVHGMLRLGPTIVWGDKDTLHAYAQLVIAVQGSPSRLAPCDAKALLHGIRQACTGPLWYFPCVRGYLPLDNAIDVPLLAWVGG